MRRGNLFLVKNDNLGSRSSDHRSRYGDAGDIVRVGHVDGTEGTLGADVDEDGDVTDLGAPAVPADIAPTEGDTTDTIRGQRGNQFFVSDDLSNATGIAEGVRR